VAEKQQASPLILLAIYGILKFFYEDTNHSPPSYAHTTHTGPEMMPSDVSPGKFPCFIFYCLINKQYSAERFLSLLASACFLCCHIFPFTTWNFLAALQLFVFSCHVMPCFFSHLHDDLAMKVLVWLSMIQLVQSGMVLHT